jgi:hypothetical protein
MEAREQWDRKLKILKAGRPSTNNLISNKTINSESTKDILR